MKYTPKEIQNFYDSEGLRIGMQFVDIKKTIIANELNHSKKPYKYSYKCSKCKFVGNDKSCQLNYCINEKMKELV